MSSTALGGVPVHHGDLHPGSCSARPQGKPGNDSGLKAVHSGETNTHKQTNTQKLSLNTVRMTSYQGSAYVQYEV